MQSNLFSALKSRLLRIGYVWDMFDGFSVFGELIGEIGDWFDKRGYSKTAFVLFIIAIFLMSVGATLTILIWIIVGLLSSSH
jgi:hypothetical protein